MLDEKLLLCMPRPLSFWFGLCFSSIGALGGACLCLCFRFLLFLLLLFIFVGQEELLLVRNS